MLDADHGLADEAAFIAWCDRNGLPPTYTVRSGRRPEFGVQSYYAGSLKDRKFELDGVTGEIKSEGGLVLAAGDIHPDTKETYFVLVDAPLAPVPEVIERSRYRKPLSEALDSGGIITENRNMTLASIAGSLWHTGKLDGDALEAALLSINANRVAPPLDEAEVKAIAEHISRYPKPEPVGTAVIGEPAASLVPVDWRAHYHTVEEHDSVGPPEFLIEGFLQRQAIMGMGAFVGQKKTLLALNVAWSLCSGEPLFGMLKVIRPPTRVLYLGPENGMMSFANRVNQIGLRDYLGKTFFYTTMSMPEKLPLTSLTREEVQGAADQTSALPTSIMVCSEEV